MKQHIIRKQLGKFLSAILLVVLGFYRVASGELIVAQWNFNGESAATVPGGVNSPLPSIGSGTASAVGGVTTAFATGANSGGSSDPVITNPPNFGWNTLTYPTQGTNEKTAGVRFDVSTLGLDNIVIRWDTRASNTSARHQQFQYSFDGTSFVDFAPLFVNDLGDTWFNQRSVDLSGIASVNNNPNFAFRFVSAFDPALNGAYTASNSPLSTYATTGTLRYDMVTVASAVPEPSSFALLGAILCLVPFARNRKSEIVSHLAD